MKKVLYFMCTTCYTIHKLELSIEVKNLNSKSEAYYNEARSIGEFIKCGKHPRLTNIQKELMLKQYKKLERKRWRIANPFNGCMGSLVEIDEKMLYAVQTLNIKGYETQFCCQGHYNGDKSNLLLAPYLHDIMMDISPPIGWVYDLDDRLYQPNTRPILKYKIKNIGSNEHIYTLNKWVNELPNLLSK